MKNIGTYFIKFSSILYCLLPVLLITGPFLPDLSLSIISIFFLFLTIKNKNLNIFNNLYFKIFIIFYFYIVLISLFSENLKLSLGASIFYIRFGIFALAICFILENSSSIIERIKIIFIFLYFLLFFDTVYQFIVGKNIIGLTYINPSNFRLTSFFGKDEVLGSYIARFYPFVLSVIFLDAYKNRKKINKFLIFFITIISICTVIMSGERTSLFLITISCFLLFLSIISLRKHIAFGMIFASIFFVLLISFDQRVKERMINSVKTQLGANTERIVVFSKTYESHYKIALNMFKEKPFFGHGVKMFRDYCARPVNFVAENACTTHPHNLYMQLLAETGLFGFILILFFFLILSYFIIKNILSATFKNIQIFSNHKLCLFIFYFTTFFPLAPSGNFFGNWLSVIYYIPAGILIYIHKEKYNEL
jgi:O-antigen ligase